MSGGSPGQCLRCKTTASRRSNILDSISFLAIRCFSRFSIVVALVCLLCLPFSSATQPRCVHRKKKKKTGMCLFSVMPTVQGRLFPRLDLILLPITLDVWMLLRNIKHSVIRKLITYVRAKW